MQRVRGAELGKGEIVATLTNPLAALLPSLRCWRASVPELVSSQQVSNLCEIKGGTGSYTYILLALVRWQQVDWHTKTG